MKNKLFFALLLLLPSVFCAQEFFYAYYSDGTIRKFPTADADSISLVAPVTSLSDICGNTYPVVTIGTQIWMAENYRCSKYDTESEAYKEGRKSVNTTTGSGIYTPYYIDASKKSKWSSTTYSSNLSDAQVAKLGYLFNWAAVVGIADGYTQTSEFIGKRQGICPNGWHVPTLAEFETLYDYIYADNKLATNQVGKYLKATSGWYNAGAPTQYPQGLDTYGFSVLPAGTSSGTDVNQVGSFTIFWMSTIGWYPAEIYGDSAKYAMGKSLQFDSNDLYHYGAANKSTGLSVRCIKGKVY